jgi:exodeoxyribonuclease VII small subunit
MLEEKSTPNMNVTNMSYEEAFKELESIVRRLESGQESLELAIVMFERAASLKKHCEQKLQAAELKIQKVISSTAGELKVEDITINFANTSEIKA